MLMGRKQARVHDLVAALVIKTAAFKKVVEE